MSGTPDDGLVPGLPGTVVGRLRSELPEHAEKILRCLRTAHALIGQAEVDDGGLRLSESAAYNLREALNAVVEGHTAAAGGLQAVIDAWRTFKTEEAEPDTDVVAAREALDQVLATVAADEARASYFARRILSYLRGRTGLSPIPGRSDPVAEYGDLRDQANTAVHAERGLADVTLLHTRTVAWFVRVFTPPDEVVDAIRSLASQPWQGEDQITALERLVTDAHHLRLFFAEVADSAWLGPLHRAGIARLPSPGTLWPVTGLLGGLGRTNPSSAAELLDWLLTDTKTKSKTEAAPRDELAAVRFELLRVAVHLGPAAHGLVAEVARLHGDHPGVRALSVDAVENADPADIVVQRVADAVLNNVRRFDPSDTYYTTVLLDQLQAGVNAENVADRARMLASKTRRLVKPPGARDAVVGIEALASDPAEDPALLVLLAHHLVRVLSKARGFGVSTSAQLEWLGEIHGEVGERVRSHVLAGADDVPLADKITHITSRLQSLTATGDDLALVTDIQSRNPPPSDLSVWTAALGTPSPAPPTGVDDIPFDWARAWRWAAVLPDHVLAGWQGPIDYVTERHGEPDQSALTRARTPSVWASFARSPYSAAHLTALPVSEAAELVAAWRPDADSDLHLVDALELARALEETVKNDPLSWCAAPTDMVTALREPIYVEHYFRALTEKAADIVPQAAAVLAAAAQARTAFDDHTAADAGAVDNESGRTATEGVILDLVRALANADAAIDASLDDLWAWALTAIRETPGAATELLFDGRDALDSAINRLWGRALESVLALAAWEIRQRGTIRTEFEPALDAVITASVTFGLEFRAILALHRPLLEGIARSWLDGRADELFRNPPLGQETFDLTVKHARPTDWLYQNFRTELFDAARQKVDQAVRKIVTAALNNVDGYSLEAVIQQFRADPTALAKAAEDAAFLVQGAGSDSPLLAAAVRFWILLVESDRAAVPDEALLGLGRWAFVSNLDDNDWADLTVRTLAATNGRVEHAFSVADRAAAISPCPASREILLCLLDNGELWERDYAARKALDVLGASNSGPGDDSFERLRTRLIDLGYHEARDILPGNDK